MPNKASGPNDFRTQIPAGAFINAQVMQNLQPADIQRSVRAVGQHYGMASDWKWPLINPAYLASLLYCLILCPKEIWDPPSNDTMYELLDKDDPLSLFQIKKWSPPANEHRLRDFVRHLRNAIAHVRFSVDRHMGFEFWDKKPKGDETFRVFITLDNLARFLSTVGAQLANLRSRTESV